MCGNYSGTHEYKRSLIPCETHCSFYIQPRDYHLTGTTSCCQEKKLSTQTHLSFLRNNHRKNPKNEQLCVSSGNMWTRAQLLDKLKQGMEGIQPLTHHLTTPDPKLKKDMRLYRFYHGWTAASCRVLFPGQVAQQETLSCPPTLSTTQQKSADSS